MVQLHVVVLLALICSISALKCYRSYGTVSNDVKPTVEDNCVRAKYCHKYVNFLTYYWPPQHLSECYGNCR
ncbi:hypothetical protein Y032_0008g39 [Ancylostoma ceylanicum]|uniref:ShKT domain-containing protein n=1 Tax=Ancylostoma ceylanicum TaxID=53326 RepID=A0A016VKR4_9BILA|nr:hypothetical protein Y032_0008g39 [Ancylostoma ceylanicum]